MSTYASRLRGRLDLPPAFGTVRRNLPEAWYEKQYQRVLLGGYNKKSKCGTCNILLPTSGVCEYC